MTGSASDRAYPRYAHEAVITLNTPGTAVSGRTTNLSRGGLCATLAEEVPVGIAIDLDIQLVFADDVQSEPLRVPGRVVWCTSVDDGHQVGVSFLPLDAERAEYLTMFLRYLDEDGEDEADDAKPSIDDRFA
ncbi:MAG TPA: PilZ domain-containing protein [Kofleriaceae bacterium]|nr:PilZ domain-containing protein [Kofleriaceae bacterium]